MTPKSSKAVLVGDITYLPLRDGKWCYLASWQNKVTRRMAGWKVSDRMTEDLAKNIEIKKKGNTSS